MMVMREIGYDFIVYSSELVVFYYLFHIFMSLKIQGKKKYFMSIGILFALVCLSVFFNIKNDNILYFLYIFSVCYTIFDSKWFHKLFVIILGLCISVIIDSITVSFLALLFQKEFRVIYYNTFLSELVVECVKLIIIVCINLLVKRLKIKNSIAYLQNKQGLFQVLFLMVLPSVSLIILMTNLNNMLRIKGGIVTLGITSAVSICLLIFNITSVTLLKKNIENHHYKQINETIEKQLTYQLKHYEELEQMNKGTIKLKHDMKNHILCIKNLMQQGKIEEAQVYMGEVAGSLEKLEHHITTGNPIADAILQEKYKQAKIKQIQLTVTGRFIPEDQIAPIDRCTVLANAVDNAIEACEKLEDIVKRSIYIDIHYNKGYTFITVKNPVSEKLNMLKGRVKTSKTDKRYHGYGLENIRQAVEKYNGMLDLKCEEEEFILQATFHAKIHIS